MGVLCGLWVASPVQGGREEGLRAYRQGDFEAAFRELRPPADRDDRTAQFFLGLMLKVGKGASRDPTEDAKWPRRATELGDGRAAFSLAGLYAKGDGVTKDLGEILGLLKLAFELGFTEGAVMADRLFAEGRDVPRDETEAVRWWLAAAGKGSVEAQMAVGFAFVRGEGVPKSYGEATKWFERAADQDNVDAQLRVATAYLDGIGVRISGATAQKWVVLEERNAKSSVASDQARGIFKVHSPAVFGARACTRRCACAGVAAKTRNESPRLGRTPAAGRERNRFLHKRPRPYRHQCARRSRLLRSSDHPTGANDGAGQSPGARRDQRSRSPKVRGSTARRRGLSRRSWRPAGRQRAGRRFSAAPTPQFGHQRDLGQYQFVGRGPRRCAFFSD